jgi:hypothetical protein
MDAIRAWFHRPEPSSGRRAEAVDIVAHWLTPDLVLTLGSLHEAPPAVADAVVQLLPFGSRAALEELGLALPGTDGADRGRRPVTLAPLAYEVMAVASARIEPGPAEADEWTRLAQRAAHPGQASNGQQ